MPPLVFPRESTSDALAKLVAQTLTLRLYSNAHFPSSIDTFASFVQVTGGGYAPIVLDPANWSITPGQPSVALYSLFQTFTFSSTPPVPTVYGYYITNAANVVLLSELFYATAAAFIPSSSKPIKIRPRFGADNLVEPVIALPPEDDV